MAQNDEAPESPARRIMMRRARGGSAGGFSGGVSTRSESLRASEDSHEPDEADTGIDPHTMQADIVARARRPAQDSEDGMVTGDGGPDPRQRLNEVAMAGSQSYSKEYRLTLLHRLLMRRVPLDQIAAQLKVSVSTVEKDRVQLKARLREQSRQLNIDEMVGGQQEVYDEIAGMAMRMASTNDIPAAMKLAAMRTALAANADRTRFLNTAGVFDVLRFRKSDDGDDISDVQRLMENTAEMLERLAVADTSDTPKTRRRVPRAGGFGAFTMDDKDASNSSDEVVDI